MGTTSFFVKNGSCPYFSGHYFFFTTFFADAFFAGAFLTATFFTGAFLADDFFVTAICVHHLLLVVLCTNKHPGYPLIFRLFSFFLELHQNFSLLTLSLKLENRLILGFIENRPLRNLG